MGDKDKIRILFYGDSPTVATGFGTVSRNLLTGLHATGKYDIFVLGVNYWGDPHKFPFPIWPIGVTSRGDPYGRQRAFDMMMKDFQFDVLFLFQDSFILDFMFKTPATGGPLPIEALRAKHNFVTVGYYPIDGIPKKDWVEGMNMCEFPVTYTEFGKRESILACPQIADKLRVIPHGANLHDFYPIPREEREQFRREFFGAHADKFIVTNINRNQQRKDIPRTMLAFKEFKKRRPNSVLYLHMAIKDQGWNLLPVCRAVGLEPARDVLFPNDFGPNQGFPIDVVNKIYNASDVIMSTTLGEGWGLSTVEAMACKTPIIFPRNTALVEIVGEDRGLLVPSGETIDDWTVLPNDNEVLRPLTSTMGMAEALLNVHDEREQAAERAERAYNWLVSNLEWGKHIVPRWDSLISEAVLSRFKGGRPDADVVRVEDL